MEKYWNSVISKQHPEAVMLVTWDDYAESTYFSPSHYPITKFAEIESFTHIGFFELEKYYIAWYRSNVKPMINNDGIFYFYRTHPIHSESVTNAGHCGLSATRPEQIWGKVDDELFITTALKTAATLRVTSGSKVASYNMAPGLNSVSTPFFPGPQKFEIVRQGRTVVTAVGRPIDAQPSTFNLNQFSGFAFANGWQSLSWQPGSKRNQGPRSRWFEAR